MSTLTRILAASALFIFALAPYSSPFAGGMKDIGKGTRASRIETTRVVVAGAGSP